MSRRLYLVTGGLGFLGASLVRSLHSAGHAVRVLDDSSRGSSARLTDLIPHIELVNADIRNGAAVRAAARGVDAVCHLAFVNGTESFYTRPAHVLEVGVKGIVNVLDACIAEGVGELILASSSEVYQTPPRVPTDEAVPLSVPDPLNPRYSYAGGKIISELMALNYGRERLERVVIFRPHNVYGPNMGWQHVIPQLTTRLAQLRAGRPADGSPVPLPIQGTGKETRAFIYIEDFTRALITVIENGHHLGIYHVGTEEEVTIRDVAERIARRVGVAIAVQPGEAAIGGTLRRCPDTRKLRGLGFSPAVNLDDGLDATVAWYVQHTPGAAPSVSRT
ncbi:MAG: NAD-dependent epimerase/dehydratase family protein [Chloroflexota bacterium]